MKYVSLRHSTIGQKGAEILAEFLKSNQALEYLFLGNTHMTDGDATLIAEALKYNTTLRVLNLGGTKINGSKNRNTITSAGLQALSKVLFNASSLYWVANSNHTCRAETVVSHLPESSRDEALLDIVNCKGTLKDNRRWKVLSVLYATNGMGIGDEFKTYQNLKVIPELLAFIAASFEGEELHTHETEVHVGDESGVSPAASSIFPSLSSLFSSSSSKKEAADDSDDELSVESDESFDSYDSELEELDDAFDEEEDEVYENFDKSFLDPAFCGERARLTIMFQVVQKWGLPLLDKNPSLAEKPLVAVEVEKQKKRRTTSWKCEPGKKGMKRNKKQRREVVISQKEIDSLAD